MRSTTTTTTADLDGFSSWRPVRVIYNGSDAREDKITLTNVGIHIGTEVDFQVVSNGHTSPTIRRKVNSHGNLYFGKRLSRWARLTPQRRGASGANEQDYSFRWSVVNQLPLIERVDVPRYRYSDRLFETEDLAKRAMATDELVRLLNAEEITGEVSSQVARALIENVARVREILDRL